MLSLVAYSVCHMSVVDDDIVALVVVVSILLYFVTVVTCLGMKSKALISLGVFIFI